MTDIAVIIVNYGTPKLALEAVGSVLTREHGGRSVEVHLVDNASPGGDAAVIQSELEARGWTDRIVFHAESENHGFGRGNNLVLKELAAREDPPHYVLLLNPDGSLENETIAVLAEFMDAHPEAGAAGAEIRKPGEEMPVTAAFRFPSMTSVAVQAVNFGPLSRAFAGSRVALKPTAEAEEVGWVAGAAVMARLKAWQEVGFFDPTYFLYYEETDLMLQTKRAGWETWYVPDAKAGHFEGQATGVKSGERTRKRHPAYLYESWRHYFSKNHGRAYALVTAILWLLCGMIGTVIARLRGRTPAMQLNFVGDITGKVIWPLLTGR
ncbi:MAG: glycosyltransferase family 2 protein [Pseudomonadota bacterium]